MLKDIKLFVVDVDGTLTNSGIYYDDFGNEIKRFSTRDAAGFFASKKAGIKTMILTGRESKATLRRMEELKIDYIFQGIKQKRTFLETFMIDNKYEKEHLAYIGDDLNDLDVMELVGYVGCPADSCKEIKEISDYISKINGGYGAVRDVIEHILRERNEWDTIIRSMYNAGV